MLPIKLELPKGFLDSEYRNDFFVDTHRKELWAVELDLLNEFDRVCKKHNIEYFADGGTLLGAVRHKGFIPWDDDIDLVMTRNNYIKLLKVAKNEFHHPYFLQTEQSDPTSIFGFAKLRNSETTMIETVYKNRNFKYNQGVWIDIFPLDKIPDNEEEVTKFQNKLLKLQEKAHLFRNRTHNDFGEKNILKYLLGKLIEIFKIKNYPYFKFEKYAQKFNKCNMKRMSKMSFRPERKKSFVCIEDYKSIDYYDFEFLKIPGQKNYDTFLTQFYGDWHKMVKPEHFHSDYIDLHKSYKYYLDEKKKDL